MQFTYSNNILWSTVTKFLTNCMKMLNINQYSVFRYFLICKNSIIPKRYLLITVHQNIGTATAKINLIVYC